MIVAKGTTIPLHSTKPSGDRPRRGPSTAVEGLLLVGHGSHCMTSAAQMHEIGDRVAAAMPDRIVEVGFLEMTDPAAGLVLDDMVARGVRRVVVLPLMLLAAGHSKSDVPAIVLEGRQRHPDLELIFGSPLGVVPELIEIAADNLTRAAAAGLPLVVVARGTSDPDANGDAAKAARLLAEWVTADGLHLGFTGVTWPTVPETLDTAAAVLAARPEAPRRLALFFWFICNGKLIERAREQIAEFTERTGIDVVDAGYFGPDAGLVPIITRRYHEAVDGTPTVNCDTCAYRSAFPGHEDKVGQAVGVGHSHLAADHRHGQGHHH